MLGAYATPDVTWRAFSKLLAAQERPTPEVPQVPHVPHVPEDKRWGGYGTQMPGSEDSRWGGYGPTDGGGTAPPKTGEGIPCRDLQMGGPFGSLGYAELESSVYDEATGTSSWCTTHRPNAPAACGDLAADLCPKTCGICT